MVAGATYIVVGPNDDPSGCQKPGLHVFQCATNNIFIGLRILDQNPAFYEQITKDFRMGRFASTMQPIRFIRGRDIEWSATAPRGLDYWRKLSEVIQEEPVREVDKAWMALVEPLGIAKGKTFAPDDRQQAILLKGATMGELMMRNLQVNPRYTEPYWSGTSWYKSFDFQIEQETADAVQIDQRATWFYEAVGTTKGMVNPQPGEGQVYMTTKRDGNGDMLRADATYKVHVPSRVPVKLFWSLTLYSENTRRPYDNGGTKTSDASLDSRMKQLKYADDGSIDPYVGSKVPAAYEPNYLKTVSDDGWFVYFRLYAPELAFFDKTFKLPDFEKIE